MLLLEGLPATSPPFFAFDLYGAVPLTYAAAGAATGSRAQVGTVSLFRAFEPGCRVPPVWDGQDGDLPYALRLRRLCAPFPTDRRLLLRRTRRAMRACLLHLATVCCWPVSMACSSPWIPDNAAVCHTAAAAAALRINLPRIARARTAVRWF